MTKIHWKFDEIHQLLPRIHQLRQEMPLANFLDALRAAQKEILPPGRQRPLYPGTAVERIERLYDSYAEKLHSKSPAHSERLVEHHLREMIRDELLLMEERLFKRLAPKPLLKPVDPPAAFTQPVEATKLGRVLIVGLLPEQQQTIMRRFQARLEFRFIDSSMLTTTNAAYRLKQLSESCDATFAMIRFIRHEHALSINRKHYVRVLGSTSNLEVELDKYLKELSDAKNRKTA